MKQATILMLAALLASGAMQGGTLSGSVQTASGDGIAATIVVLSNPQGAAVETHDTAEDGTFSIELPSGAFAAAATATVPSSHEIDLSNGVPSGPVRFGLRELGFSSGMLRDNRGRAVVGAKTRLIPH